MKDIIKYIVGRTYKPLLVKYLSGTRNYSYKGIVLAIPPEVFHPGFFSSTKILLRHIRNENGLFQLGSGHGRTTEITDITLSEVGEDLFFWV